ncbi:MAG: hypothetical protein IJ702_05865, partial [Fretibacterium sp.]|nr:hypothetical protein [Fretibacterium sp.]
MFVTKRRVFLVVIIAALAAGFWAWNSRTPAPSFEASFQAKADLLEGSILTDEVRRELGSHDRYTVFISVCDGTKRASVRSGTGDTLDAAWALARRTAATLKIEPLWMKADVAASSKSLSSAGLKQALLASRQEFYRFGLAWEETALLEEELNGAGIYDYKRGNVDL